MKTSFWLLISLVGSSTLATGAERPELTPAIFVEQVAQDGMTSTALGELALKKSASPAVQEFAHLMIAEQERWASELAAIARANGFTAPAEMDAMHQALVMAVDTEEGASFDHVYAGHMKAGHERVIELFEAAAKSGDPDLAQFAQNALPTLKQNNSLAKKLARMAR